MRAAEARSLRNRVEPRMMKSGPVASRVTICQDRHAGGEAVDEHVDAERRDEGADFVGQRVAGAQVVDADAQDQRQAQHGGNHILPEGHAGRGSCRSRHTRPASAAAIAAGWSRQGEAATSIKAAPVAAVLVDEETWFMVDPFRSRFPQGVTGIDDGCVRPTGIGAGAQEPALSPVLFHPDYTVGPELPDLLSPRSRGGARRLWDFSHLPRVKCTRAKRQRHHPLRLGDGNLSPAALLARADMRTNCRPAGERWIGFASTPCAPGCRTSHDQRCRSTTPAARRRRR